MRAFPLANPISPHSSSRLELTLPTNSVLSSLYVPYPSTILSRTRLNRPIERPDHPAV
jgi:hypothetical protein